jgi:hypothetical protein
MMMRGIFCLLTAVGLLIYNFPILRGQRITQPLTPDQKIWRVLVVITALLLLGLGAKFLLVAVKAKSGAP